MKLNIESIYLTNLIYYPRLLVKEFILMQKHFAASARVTIEFTKENFQQKLTIEAKYSIPEEMSFAICKRFNRLSLCGGSSSAATFPAVEPTILMQVGSWRASSRCESGPLDLNIPKWIEI